MPRPSKSAVLVYLASNRGVDSRLDDVGPALVFGKVRHATTIGEEVRLLEIGFPPHGT